MNIRMRALTQVAPTPSFTPVQRGFLQRKCACGTRTMGGGECTDCAKKRSPLQRKLVIGASNDPLEHEADRIAEHVMRVSPTDLTTGHNGNRVKPLVQRRISGSASGLAEAPPIVHQVLSSQGQPLDATTRAFFEARFGYDLSHVRVHADPRANESAHAVDAAAFTVGQHIVFGAGEYQPHTAAGQQLCAHELAHVSQQNWNAGLSGDPIGEPVLRRQSLRERAASTLRRVRDAIIDPRTRQFMSDMIASVREAPQHVGEFITGDLWESIREHWPSILAVTLGLLAAETIIGALGAAPTGVTQVIAAILEIIVVAILASFAAVEVGGAVDEGVKWWSAAREANGDSGRISEASRAFVRMVWHIFMAVLAVAGVRARIRSGAVGRVTAPFRETPPAPAPPRLTLHQGGDPGPVRIEGGRVRSSRPTSAGSSGGRPVARASGSTAPALEPVPVPETPTPPLRAVPDPVATPRGAGVAAPRGRVGPVDVAGATAAGVSAATSETTDRRRRCSTEPCAHPLPISWPTELPIPSTIGARGLIRMSRGDREWEGIDRGPEQARLRGEIDAARRRLIPPPQPCFGDDAEPNTPFDAHHIQPLYLGGEDAQFNLCALETGRHIIRGHPRLDNQREHETEYLECGICSPMLSRHPIGQTYEIVGSK